MSIPKTKREIVRKIESLRQEIAFLESIQTGCHTCMDWCFNECNRYGEKPPPDVILIGCSEWNWDEVPF